MTTDTATRRQVVDESPRRLPLEGAVDVAVLGGSVSAVAAALAAARAGRRVFLAAPRPFLGEDLCSTLRLWTDRPPGPDSPLAAALFASGLTTTPHRVKRVLTAALVEAGVEFVLGAYATEALRDRAGRVAGVVLANAAGRQAIPSRAVVDASHGAWFARRVGAATWRRSEGVRRFRRVVLGPAASSSGFDGFVAAHPADVGPGGLAYVEIAMEDGADEADVAAWAEFEQRLHDASYRPGQCRGAERFLCVPFEAVVGLSRAAAWQDGALSPGHFLPAGVAGVAVAGPAADIPAAAAARLVEDVACAEAVGTLVGVAVSEGLPGHVGEVGAPRWGASSGMDVVAADVMEEARGFRLGGDPEGLVRCEGGWLPVLASCDVVVAGGGTAGASAALAVARSGRRVVVIEYQEGLGGTGTLGMIGKPYHGRAVGHGAEVPFPGPEVTLEDKMAWFRRSLRDAGGAVWFGVLCCGAVVQSGRVCGVVVATERGRGVVLASVVIDATGAAGVAIAAGGEPILSADAVDLAVQGAGVAERPPCGIYVNTDYLLVDPADVVDVTCAIAGAELALPDTAYDSAPLVQTRERRRVRGDHVLDYLDQITGRTYADAVVLSSSDYDSHGYPSLDYFAMLPHSPESLKANHPAPGGAAWTPYRCLLPRGLEGILVVGLGISMHRDASALVRMQRDLHNQGYAAGLAAVQALEEDCTPRQIDRRRLQRRLVAMGALPAAVLEHRDCGDVPPAALAEAVEALTETAPSARLDACRALAVLMTQRRAGRDLVREALPRAVGEAHTRLAMLLAWMGDDAGREHLLERLSQVSAWDDRILQGAMAEYAHLPTPVDGLILALGALREPRCLPHLSRLAARLDAESPLSHIRSLARALEALGDPSGARIVTALLSRPGFRGHALHSIVPLHDKPMERRRRLGPLREIVLARALYRLGDPDGLGREILSEYQRDRRGLLAQHATAVLRQGLLPGCSRRRFCAPFWQNTRRS